MIKAIILDIDGVIIGEKIGYNSPDPHQDVLNALKIVRNNGIVVCLCTAKPHYAITNIIKSASLHNPHVTDAGAVIINPIDNIIIEKHIIDRHLANEILHLLLSRNIYTEFYTVDNYFIPEDVDSRITDKHTHILQKEPLRLKNFLVESAKYEITKIMPITVDENEKKLVSNLLEQYKIKASISWGTHPVALPLQFGIITALNSSKKEGVETIMKNLGISFDNALGIGDSSSDWSFIQLCRYGATPANGAEKLKENLKTKNEGYYFISESSVDENAILDILKYFSL